MLNFFLAIFLLAAEPPASPTTQETTQSTTRAGTLPQLVAVDARAQAIGSISADFVQEKQSPLLSDPLITRGTVKAMGSHVLWSATQPKPTPTVLSQTHLSQTQLQIYYPKQKLVEEYALTPATAALTASPLPRLSALQSTFDLSLDAGEGLPMQDGSIALKLVPREADLAKYVDQVRVLLDEKRGVVIAFELTDPDGEVTLTRFENVQVNPNLQPADVELQLPADVKHVSPGGSAR